MEINQIVGITAAIFGSTAIILGAFGAHALKKILTEDKLASFETGVKYQMYSALALLCISMTMDFNKSSQSVAFYCISIGTVLFSGSIYGLSLASYLNKNLKFLGPITPLGGLLMIIGWVAIMVSYF